MSAAEAGAGLIQGSHLQLFQATLNLAFVLLPVLSELHVCPIGAGAGL